MAADLTRRPDKGPSHESWFVYFGDVRVGHIGLRTGVPVLEPQWGWTCGFYPGCDPGQQTHGTGESFEEAKAGFEERPETANADEERPGALLLRRGDNQPLARRAHPDISPRHWGLKEINLRPYETSGLLPKTTLDELTPADSHSGRR